MRYRLTNLIALALILITCTFTVGAAQNDPTAGFSELLSQHVKDGFVNYAGFAASQPFADYLQSIAHQDSADFDSEEDQAAFYINAYNALTISSIVNGRSPSNLLGRMRFFKLTKHEVAGESLSLYDLEHKKIIVLGDSRIHFAIVCAALSCPPLRSEVYRAEKLDEQLDAQAIQFINDATRNSFDTNNSTATVSKIFKWYRKEFETDDRTLADYLAFYVRDPAVAEALKSGEIRIRFNKYDWSLNGSRP